MLLLQYSAGLTDGQMPGDCPDLGGAGPASGFPWGDVNCDGAVNALDSLFVLAHLADITLTPATLPCTPVGS